MLLKVIPRMGQCLLRKPKFGENTRNHRSLQTSHGCVAPNMMPSAHSCAKVPKLRPNSSNLFQAFQIFREGLNVWRISEHRLIGVEVWANGLGVVEGGEFRA